MSISLVQLGWAAGFLEGEGSFTNGGSPCVSAGQVQREPLERLSALFGGRISQRAPKGVWQQTNVDMDVAIGAFRTSHDDTLLPHVSQATGADSDWAG